MTAHKTTTKKPAVRKPAAKRPLTKAGVSKTKHIEREKNTRDDMSWAEMQKTIRGVLKRNAKALEKLARL
jgi:hypothetical protein